MSHRSEYLWKGEPRPELWGIQASEAIKQQKETTEPKEQIVRC